MAGARLDLNRMPLLLGAIAALACCAAIAVAQNTGTLPPPSVANGPTVQEIMVVSVNVVGNRNISTSKVLAAINSRPERPFNQAMFEKDVRTLAAKGWFLDVKPIREMVPGGVALTFKVVERPTLQYVKYIGNKKVKEKTLAKKSELKSGGALDPYAIEEGRRKLEEFYKERGYNHVQITVIEGTKPGDRGAIFLINEGTSQKVWTVKFIGNTIASDARLKTQIQSKPPLAYLFKGYVERNKIDEDVDRLTAYYRSLGFFRARVGRELEFDEDNEWLTLTFVIDEGPRYSVRNVSFLGNTKYDNNQLSENLELKGGKYFDQARMNRDIGLVRDIYGSQGYIFADVQADPRFLEEPGQIDLVYNIAEGDRYRVSRINVHIGGESPHTRHNTVLNRISLHPGDIVDIRQLRASERRLRASGLFLADPTKGNPPKITFSPPGVEKDEEELAGKKPKNFRGQSPDPSNSGDKYIGISIDGHLDPRWRGSEMPSQSEERAAQEGHLDRSLDLRQPPQATTVRGQSPDQGYFDPRFQPTQYVGGSVPGAISPDQTRFQSPGPGVTAYQPYPGTPTYQPQPTYSPNTVYQGGRLPPGAAPPPQYAAPGTQPFGQPSFNGPSYGQAAPPPSSDGQPFYNPNYNQTQPPPIVGFDGNPIMRDQPEPEKFIPLDAFVEETQTGRIMFGVGVNSDAGLVGSIVIDEQNFDWKRVPTSFEDFRNGTAFRGGGQRFRIEAAPGTQVQRYMFNFQEPYLFDTPVSFGLSGFYYQRFFTDWNEARLGGRTSLGYQFSPDLTGTVSLGAQRVDISNPRTPTPQELEEVLGYTDLYTGRAQLAHDTRDNTFLATEGHYIELGVEYNFGTFQFPRATVDMRQYFMLRERPDGSGRHVLSLIGRLGVSGSDTPIYEHFFAGGFSTMRGFAFRGASPVVDKVTVGGEFQALGTVEYLYPITADDMLRGVAFVDFGTVSPNANLDSDTLRVAPGLGLRITVPAMGPAPIALDFAFPVLKASTDDEQIFSFFVGFGR